jgi:hypothetical protein
MKPFVVVTLFLSVALLAQDTKPSDKHNRKDEITIQGCVSRSNGDYILMKQDPGITYQLQATGKTRLKNYLGQRVEVTAFESPTLSSSSDAMNKIGSAAPETLTITSIRMLDKNCSARNVPRN